MRSLIQPSAALFLILAIHAEAQIGGTCAYDRYVGTASITRIAQIAGKPHDFDAYFKFASNTPVPQQYRTIANQEFPFSSVPGSRALYSTLEIKPGHVYECTLSVIRTGTCTPWIIGFKKPESWKGYDTASLWIDPDTVHAADSIAVNLIDYGFNCTTVFSNISASKAGDSIYFNYRAEDLLDIACGSAGPLYGIAYTLKSLNAGRYAVFSAREPDCYPLCRIALIPTFVDWLVVEKPVASASWQLPYSNVERSAPAMMRIFDIRGALVDSRENAVPATGLIHAGHYAVRVVAPSGQAAGHKLSFVNK